MYFIVIVFLNGSWRVLAQFVDINCNQKQKINVLIVKPLKICGYVYYVETLDVVGIKMSTQNFISKRQVDTI